MTSAPSQLPGPAGPAGGWFCLRSGAKQEHIAAGHLRKLPEVEVFLPRIRFKRSTRRGWVWVTEALFPGYLFARFDWRRLFRAVHHTPSVRGLVHFGPSYPTVNPAAMEELRAAFGDDAIHVLRPEMNPGDSVEMLAGPLAGLQAVVQVVMSGRHRIRVLLEFLGRQTVVEVGAESVARRAEPRLAVAPALPAAGPAHAGGAGARHWREGLPCGS